MNQKNLELNKSSLHTKKDRKLIALAIILFIIFVSLLTYLILPNKVINQLEVMPAVSPTVPIPIPTIDKTSNWKTYINTKYDYSIKYPPEIYLAPDVNSASTDAYFPKKDAVYLIEQSFHIIVSDNPNNLTFEKWLKTPAVTNNYLNHPSVSIKKVTTNNIDWFTTDDQAGLLGLPPSLSFRWTVLHNSEVFLFSDFPSNNQNLYNQILSTFKFIDQKIISPTLTAPDSISSESQKIGTY